MVAIATSEAQWTSINPCVRPPNAPNTILPALLVGAMAKVEDRHTVGTTAVGSEDVAAATG